MPSAADYKAFQDLVFRHVLTECGRLHLPVHIHSAAGAGDYFSLAGASVLNLETVLRDPRYLATTFVLIHGGYPFDQQAILIAMMKNVWLDSSATGSFLMYPNQFKDVLKRWFEINPGKVTFGSDAFPIDEHDRRRGAVLVRRAQRAHRRRGRARRDGRGARDHRAAGDDHRARLPARQRRRVVPMTPAIRPDRPTRPRAVAAAAAPGSGLPRSAPLLRRHRLQPALGRGRGGRRPERAA